MAFQKLKLSPESLVYTGTYVNEPLCIEVFTENQGKVTRQVFDKTHVAKIVKILSHSPNKAWVNIVGLNDVEAIGEFGKALQLSGLYIEDILNVQQRCKYEEGEKYALITLKMLMKQGFVSRKKRRVESVEIHVEHLSLLVKGNLVVTFQENAEDVFDKLREDLLSETSVVGRGVDYWAYLMLDAVVDHQMAILSDLADLLDGFETHLIDSKRIDLEGLYHLRKNLLIIKRSVLPLKDVFVYCLKTDNPGFTRETIDYLRDVDDHLNHVIEQHQHLRDMISNLFEMNGTEASNRMNRIMTTLTVFSAVFIPLNFLAGVFGMNFKYFEWLNAPNGVNYFVIFSVILSVVLLGVFKALRW